MIPKPPHAPPAECELPALCIRSILGQPKHGPHRWIVTRITRAGVWVNTYPIPAGEQPIPFLWPLVNTLTVIGHESDFTHGVAA
jgi:hypothetical protein